MKPVVLILILALAGFGAWFAFSQSGDDDTPSVEPLEADTDLAPKKPDNNAELTARDKTTTPKVVLEPEKALLTTPANALLIARHKNVWTKTVVMACEMTPDLGFATWYLETPEGKPEAGDAHGLAKLTEKPTAEYLEKHDIRALLFDAADPNIFPKAFWEIVSKRVRSGHRGAA